MDTTRSSVRVEPRQQRTIQSNLGRERSCIELDILSLQFSGGTPASGVRACVERRDSWNLYAAGYWEFLRLLVPIGRPAFPIPAGINDWRLNSLNLHQGNPRSGSAKQKCVISEVNSTEPGIVASDQNTPLDGLGLEQEGQGCFTDAMDAVRSLELSVTAADGCRSKTRSTGWSGLLLW